MNPKKAETYENPRRLVRGAWGTTWRVCEENSSWVQCFHSGEWQNYPFRWGSSGVEARGAVLSADAWECTSVEAGQWYSYASDVAEAALRELVGPPPWEATLTKTEEPKTLSDDAPATVGMLRKAIKELKLHVKTLQYPKTAPTVAAYSEEVERERRDRLAKDWLLQFPKNLKEAMRLARSEDTAEVDALEEALETAYQDMDRRMWDCDEWSRYNEELQKSARQAFKESVRSLLDKLNDKKEAP